MSLRVLHNSFSSFVSGGGGIGWSRFLDWLVLVVGNCVIKDLVITTMDFEELRPCSNRTFSSSKVIEIGVLILETTRAG